MQERGKEIIAYLGEKDKKDRGSISALQTAL